MRGNSVNIVLDLQKSTRANPRETMRRKRRTHKSSGPDPLTMKGLTRSMMEDWRYVPGRQYFPEGVSSGL